MVSNARMANYGNDDSSFALVNSSILCDPNEWILDPRSTYHVFQ